MRNIKNKRSQSELLITLISLIVLSSSAFFVGNSNMTGSVISDLEFNNTLEKIIEIEVLADTLIELNIEQNNLTTTLYLDNGTSIINQELEFYLNGSLIVTEKINSESYKPNFDLYNIGPGIYSIEVVFQGSDILYLNPTLTKIQIEIKEDKTIEIISLEELEIPKIPETNITLKLNDTNLTIIPTNLICKEFTEQVLWSSGYSLLPPGSTNYETWDLQYNCSELDVATCFIQDIKIKTRFLSFGEKNQNIEGYVQISEPDNSICDNSKKADYQKYLANEILIGDDKKMKDYCGKKENCAIKTFKNYDNANCYGIKLYADQYMITDVFEINYNLCYQAGGAE